MKSLSETSQPVIRKQTPHGHCRACQVTNKQKIVKCKQTTMTQLTEPNTAATVKYISCGCNRLPNCLDWGKNNLVCYGSNNSVAVYDAGKFPFGKVERTLQGHSQKVTVTQWIKPSQSQNETEFISASADGSAIIWTRNNTSFSPSSMLKLGEPISICTTIEKSSGLLIFLGSIHGTFQVWQRVDKDVCLLQTLDLNKKLALVSKFCQLPNDKTILAIALEDFSIRIFVQDQVEFEPRSILTGHEDWVISMDFTVDSNVVLLASGSQDHFIRLWKIAENVEVDDKNELRVSKQVFKVFDKSYEVTLESVLCGHSGWVYGLDWSRKDECLRLLSASLDKTMIVWVYNSETAVWTEQVRMGDVGGNSLGFYGCKFAPDGEGVIAHGFQGTIHRWGHSCKDDCWTPLPAPTGHFGEVVDMFWDSRGRFLVTTSTDQTTRIHAPWILQSTEAQWYEISRPQVHGYNMSCASLITSNMFASGAEEKVVRIFQAPLTFQKYLLSITASNKSDSSFEGLAFQSTTDDESLEQNLVADSASVPALGLTNKAVFSKDEVKEESLRIGSSIMLDYTRPPLEEELIQHTLWPEAEKLYGHGYELFAMAATANGELLATACKSTSQEHAAVILWSTKTWAQVQKLKFHQLTVTQLEFSADSKYLLAVSRDRLWSVYKKSENSDYELYMNMEKNCLHKRIIWCCSWASDSIHFATGSRDGKIGIWNVNEKSDYRSIDTDGNSVTAISFAKSGVLDGVEVLAAGFESGVIEVFFGKKFDDWMKVLSFDTSFAHHLTVRRLRFRPVTVGKKLQLASCGSDGAVKIYEIDLSKTALQR